MSYETKTIRNVCLLGHGGSGKTTLAESMLYMTGAIDRQGKVADGNTVCDYDAEEIKRQITISTGIAPVNYGGCKINVLDCPGFFDFAGEVMCALRAVEAGIIFCSAKDGISVGAERSWKYLKNANMPTMFYISKTDEDHGDFDAVLAALQEKYGSTVCAVTAPMSDGTGVIDLVHNVAYQTKGNKTVKVDVPAADADKVEALRETLFETAAGADEELMEKFFEDMMLSEEDTIKGIRIGLKDRSVIPVLCGSAASGIGTEAVLQAIVDYVPNPAEMPAVPTADGKTLTVDPNGAPCAFVFKTISDQFGKYSFIKVLSGTITSDLSLRNTRARSTDKLGRMYTICGKKTTEVKEACCGDIVAVGKMDWKTGDTVCDAKSEVELPAIELPEPCYSMAISPKTKGQDDKVASGLARLNEEDISFTLVNNAETHQMVISGAGDIQVDVLCSKLKSRFGVETELKPARVAYREKIKGKVEAHGRHKKQSGGSGQFGDVWIRFEPQDESDDMIFAEEVFGGSVPKNFFPSVEKGLRNAVTKGVLAGYPLVGLKATLYDGSYHPVDSNDMAFQTAARLAYQDGIPKAKPTILEPIGLLKVTIPDANLGDIMSDISSKRRGTVLGMTAEDGMQTVEAEVPMAEMSSYTIDLRSMTQGRGSFSCKFVRYEEAPGNVQQKVIEEAKAEQE
ncbi:MAG: elongation factor G [Oscillospiraceae bacterium]|nr:elongation factor G [Clostridiales bacterium]MDD6077268.1 elongation factor G [Clostridiales bacterium]MDD6937182.1 elongation factor G [Clostridiales bacterium]MDY2962209.1 elongation factor G [Oscillospiraceae bacterium]MDY6094702.1 elongation factor G [Oscillospiraceae bacterium]